MVSASIQRELAQTVPEDNLQLGELESVHSADFTSPGETLAGAIGFGVVAALGVAGLLFVEVTPDQQTAKNSVMAVVILVTLSLSLFSAVMCVRHWGNRFRYGRHWLIYSNGLAVLEAGQVSEHSWSNVTVWFEKSAPLPFRANRKQYKLTGRKKKKISLPGFNKRKCLQLMLAIQDKQAEALVPELEESLRAGGTICFGTVELTSSGIAVDGQSAAWSDVRRLHFTYDRASIDLHMTIECRDGRPLIGYLSKIPNVWVMFSLIRALRPKTAQKIVDAESLLK